MHKTTFSRRLVLQLAAGSLALPKSALGAATDGVGASLCLGFSLYGMKTVPLGVALKTCSEIGYTHVEFALNEGYATEPAQFSKEDRILATVKLKELNLGLPSLMMNISLTANDKAHAQSLQLIAAAGRVGRDILPKNPPILETVLGGTPTKWEEQKSGMADKLRDWALAAQQAKTIIAIKAHVNSAVNSPERLLWLLDVVKSPAIEAAYDYSHFELQGIDMEESLKLLLPRTKFIHVKDRQGDSTKFQFLLPGEGRTDYVKYFSLLRKLGYKGPVCVEVSGQVFNKKEYDPIGAAKKCYATLSEALKRAT
ncbi:MAG TPA: sugar phosphate isomerase/epimerase [Pirellula sp.]|nr:sugar phosphate isomerase/epimerase [Pirellula sp.]